MKFHNAAPARQAADRALVPCCCRPASGSGCAVAAPREGRIARTSNLEGLEAEHPEAPPAPASLRQRYPLTRCDSAQFGLELRFRSRPIGGRPRLEEAVRDRRIHTGMPGDRGRGEPAFARRDADAVQVDATRWEAHVGSIRQRRGIHRCSRHAVAARRKRRPRVYRTWQPLEERICRKLQRQTSRRVTEPGMVSQPG